MGHTGGYNPQIMVHHSEGYVSEKWAFCVYFVQLRWSKKPELVDSIPEGRSLPYTVIPPRKDPTKGPSRESIGHTDGYNPQIMVHHSEAYLSEKWAFCVYFVQLAWSKKLESLDLITEGRSLSYAVIGPTNDPIEGTYRESMEHTGEYNPQIMLGHSEGYLSEKRAFCAYFVQLAWSKKPELVDSIPEGRSLPYTVIRPRNDPTKGPSRECLGRTDGYNPRITVHHSESYLSQKWAFCVYFV